MDNLGKIPATSGGKSGGKMSSAKSGTKTAAKPEIAPTITRKAMPKKMTAERAAVTPEQPNEEQRRGMIAVAAYLRAERRGFSGDPTEDWLAAEAEIEQRFSKR